MKLFEKLRKIFRRKKKNTTEEGDGTISTSSFEYWPKEDAHETVINNREDSNLAPVLVTRSNVQKVKRVGGQCIVPVTAELELKLKSRQLQSVRVLPSTAKPPLPPKPTKSMHRKPCIAQEAPKPAPRKSLQSARRTKPTPVPRRRLPPARDFDPITEYVWKHTANYHEELDYCN